MRTSRWVGFGLVSIAYAAAGLAAWAVVATTPGDRPLWHTFEADLAATVVVFLFSVAAGNASLYDPYWSVAPAVIVVAWTLGRGGGSARQILVLTLVLIWAVRLTANWAVGWRGLGHEDWRYVRLREQRPRWLPFWVVSLTGIQLMPTLVVFAGLLPVWAATTMPDRPFGPLDVLAVVVTAGAIVTETVADLQLHRFAGDPANRARILATGLWRYSRHPNYLGEVGFWWGLWLFGLAAAPGWWWSVAGPIVMVLLFAFVSVPMMDRRSVARRPAYAKHMRDVPALLPRPRREVTADRP
jgi:steroid 5-alpha reductase family enzyme